MRKAKNIWFKDGRCLSIVLVVVLIGFVSDVYSGVNMNVDSCGGWECSEAGALCPPSADGANGHMYVCDGNEWTLLPNVII
jgi:hypothetical protein